MPTLRRRIYGLVLPVMVVAMAVTLVCSAVISLQGFSRIETDQAQEQAQRLAAMVRSELGELDADVVDYSAWDDTCRFVGGEDPGYPERNLVDSLYESFRLNLVVILDTSNQVIWGQGFDLTSGQGEAVPDSLLGHLAAGSPLLTHETPESAVSGSLMLDSQPWLVASRPIVDSNGEGPIRGTLIMGRVIDQRYVSELGTRLQQDLSIYPPSGGQHPEEEVVISSLLSSGQPAVATSSDGKSLTAYVAIDDLGGGPSLVLQTETPRLLYEQGRTSAVTLGILLAGTLAIFGLILALILERSVLQPLGGLAHDVRSLRLGQLTGVRVGKKASRELACVAEEINDLVGELEFSRTQLQDRYHAARKLADRDSLTGLLNHRALFEHLEQGLRRARRLRESLSVVLMDFDDFKLINDSFGHLRGDEVLRRVGVVIQAQARASDLLGRYGGDEFLAILPGTDRQEAVTFAGRVLEALAVEEREETRRETQVPVIPLALSCGIASYPECGEEVNELVAYADANLYRAKAAGGGTVTSGSSREGWGPESAGAFGMLEGLIAAINNKDRYTRRHSEEVAAHAVAIAQALELSEQEQRSLRIAGLLHDVGKIGVPEYILRKPEGLDVQERAMVERHVEIGELLIKDVPYAEAVKEAIAAHHERWDGRGYPRGLVGTQASLSGRILAVADAYAAMTSRRPYRKAQSPTQALQELSRAGGTQLDPEIVDVFVGLRLKDSVMQKNDKSSSAPLSNLASVLTSAPASTQGPGAI